MITLKGHLIKPLPEIFSMIISNTISLDLVDKINLDLTEKVPDFALNETSPLLYYFYLNILLKNNLKQE